MLLRIKFYGTYGRVNASHRKITETLKMHEKCEAACG
jgi:hypothetical protein